MVYALIACFTIWAWLQERNKRKIAYVMHIQERTEEAETLDFAVNLFADESESEWKTKMNKAFLLAETRRSFNNERMMQEYAKAQKAQAEAQAVPFKKA